VGGPAPDGGVDLMLDRQGSRVVVQCKRWKSAQVGVTLIREFFGVTVAEKAERGIFVTTGTFTPDAVEFARGKPIELVPSTGYTERRTKRALRASERRSNTRAMARTKYSAITPVRGRVEFPADVRDQWNRREDADREQGPADLTALLRFQQAAEQQREAGAAGCARCRD